MLFPEHIAVTQLGIRTRSMLLVDNTFLVSVLLCRTGSKRECPATGKFILPLPERDYIALVCTMNQKHDGALDYYLFPKMDMWKSHRLRRNDPLEGSDSETQSLGGFLRHGLKASEGAGRRQQTKICFRSSRFVLRGRLHDYR